MLSNLLTREGQNSLRLPAASAVRQIMCKFLEVDFFLTTSCARLSNNEIESERFAYRLLFTRMTAKRHGQADRVIEFIDPKSEMAKNSPYRGQSRIPARLGEVFAFDGRCREARRGS
jgi:hypothetical protein